MSNVIDVKNNKEFEANAATGNVVLLFTAPSWCVPCQRLEPHFERAATQLNKIKFVRVNLDTADPEWARTASDTFKVSGVPSLYHLKNGERVGDVKARTVMQFVKEFSDEDGS